MLTRRIPTTYWVARGCMLRFPRSTSTAVRNASRPTKVVVSRAALLKTQYLTDAKLTLQGLPFGRAQKSQKIERGIDSPMLFFETDEI